MVTADASLLWGLGLGTVAVALATLLPLLPHRHWTVRGLDFPRLQIAVVALALAVFEFVLLDSNSAMTWFLILVTALCLVAQLWWIVPYTPLWPKEVRKARQDDPEHTLTILTSNVLTPNRNAAALIRLVRQHRPDVLVTLESDQWWQNQLAVLEDEMPFSIKCPLDNLYGMHVFSRLPLIESECRYLIEDKVPSMHALVELRSGDRVRIHFLHPAPPSPTENPESAERDAELVIVGRSVADCNEPIIVTGDLNDVAWSPTTRLFRKVSGLLDPRVGRGLYSTFHADHPFMRWPLDHLFHSDHFTLALIARLPSIGSDHFPLLTSVVYAPGQGGDQEPLEAEEGDQEYARSLAREKGASKDDVPEPGR
ncbi:endonuclease/exonuclease/phosphatase family protein [Marinobacter sp. M216]|uniref:Endonuclease/exonuclease/phosphatase family protein n=1 Tax=Marinobacter albus TaxID=3030833 RepID=A0ABT7H9D1_9GAMM|nr:MULTISPECIES: endonuclease/exonuclease/phosphatase family protein [unclassified Marinobacter]MBW7470779.1 endonuclease/exonuclease/phosphatase family protein [Marinobacter sp. F4218]MDK9556951.1 endonuclease/exonuclease/phosphatase family protein [Marinobacter sp. M216]